MLENIVERRIMWGDLDSLGIVFYPRYYEWLDGCSHLFFEALGLPMDQMLQNNKLTFGLVQTSCRYHKAGRYHQNIQIVTSLKELKKKTITLNHLVKDASDDSSMVEGNEVRICMDVSDPNNLQAVDIPDAIYQALSRALVK